MYIYRFLFASLIVCILLARPFLWAGIKEWRDSRGEVLSIVVNQQILSYIDEADRSEELGAYIDALSSLKKAYVLEARDLGVLERLGRVYHKLGKDELAYPFLKEAIQLGSRDINTYMLFSMIAEGKDQIEYILETLYSSLDLFESDSDWEQLYKRIEELANRHGAKKFLYRIIGRKLMSYMADIDAKVDKIKDSYVGLPQNQIDVVVGDLWNGYNKILDVLSIYPWAIDILSYEHRRRLDQITLGMQLIGRGYKRAGIEKMLQSNVSLLKEKGLFE